MRGVFKERRPAEETRAQLRVPPDVVPVAHLALKKPRQQQALRARHFHHLAVALQGGVRHEVVKDRAEIRGGRPVALGVCGHRPTSAAVGLLTISLH